MLYEKEAFIGYGGDIPSGLDPDGELKNIVNAFGLSRYHILGKLNILVDPALVWGDERLRDFRLKFILDEQANDMIMVASQKAAIQKIVGKIPY